MTVHIESDTKVSKPPFKDASYTFSDTTARYRVDAATGAIGLDLFPAAMASSLVARRKTLAGEPEIDLLPDPQPPVASVIDPVAHVKIVGDEYSGAFAQGRTMRGAPSNERFKMIEQRQETQGDRTVVLTVLASAEGYRIEHRLSWYEGEGAAQVQTSFINGSDQPVTLEMLTSFSLGNITPFDAADAPAPGITPAPGIAPAPAPAPGIAPGRLRVHRFRSVWSAEGRLETQTIEQLHLERSWSGAGKFSERFGQVGSMPVRGWFPFVAVEDTAAGVTWGAQLAWAGSWQMEVFRQHDDVCISGGLADREFGQWMKTVAPGETLEAPPAVVACVQGGLDDLCDRLTAAQVRAVGQHPQVERDLPVIFNEWCTTWGDPSHDRLVGIADRLKGTGVKYLVIDAGWYKGEKGDWGNGHGDWVPSTKLFPKGLKATADAIRERGLIPGLWYEMETVGEASDAYHQTDLLLQRDGCPLSVRQRRFWDLNNPAAVDILTRKVIDLLDACGFGYLKVDYNETIGIGSDHPDGQGEGLRQQTLGTYRFFDRIRQRLPQLVIENCSSGGHRLEPAMIGRTAMSSFSDAHETREIPIVAANLHRLMLPRQSQIWAVLHASDSDRRLIYSLAATFLGRMCLSGDVDRLTEAQWSIVQRAIDLYRQAAPIIRDGVSRRYGEMGESWRHPTGWQAVVRTAVDGRSAMVVLHGFEGTQREVAISLPTGAAWRVTYHLAEDGSRCEVRDGQLTCTISGDFAGQVVLLKRA